MIFPCVEDYNKGILCDVILRYIVSTHRFTILSAKKKFQQQLVKHCYLSVSAVVGSSKRQGKEKKMSCDMRFITMWYVRPAKSQISLRIRAV